MAVQGPMTITHNMLFSLPLGMKRFKQSWKTLSAVIRGKNPEYTELIIKIPGLIRVWIWWCPFDAISDSIYLTNFNEYS